MPKKKKIAPTDDEVAATESEGTYDYAEVATVLDGLPDGQLGDLHALALQVIKDALTGMRVLVHCKSEPQLIRGVGSLWSIDTEDGGRYVYSYKPDIKLAQFVAQHSEGKPGTREIAARATTIVFQAALPGHDAEINRYLASLDEATLAKYEFDDQVMEAIKAAKADSS